MSGDMLSVMNQFVISKNLHYLYRPLGTNPYKSNGKGDWGGGGKGGGGGAKHASKVPENISAKSSVQEK